MANEITISGNLQVNKSGGISRVFSLSSNAQDLSSELATSGPQNIGTTEEAVNLGDVTDPGYGWFKNLDATNYVEIGSMNAATFVPFLKLLPGQFAGPLPLGTTAPYAKANTAAVNLDFFIIDR